VAFLVLSFSYQHLKQINQKQVLFFSLRKNTAIALIKGNKATLISDLHPNEFTYSYSIKPYLDSCHIKYIELINPHLTKGEKIITFEGYKLKIINHRDDFYLPSKINWLVLSGVKIQKISEILNANSFDYLFLDSKNSNKVVLDIKKRTSKKQLKSYILKREPAVEIKLRKRLFRKN
jgi:competence protein ComEC